MPHHSKVVTDCLQQEDIIEIDQPAQPFDCNPIEHLWDELGHAINNMGHPPHNFPRNFARPCGISGPISPWKARSVWGPECPGDQRPLSELGTVTHHNNHSTLETCDNALYVWNCSMIGYVLTNARKFESPYLMEFHFAQYSELPQIVWKCISNPNTGTIHLKSNNSAQLCLRDTPEFNNWWDTRQKCHNLGVGQPIFQGCISLPQESTLIKMESSCVYIRTPNSTCVSGSVCMYVFVYVWLSSGLTGWLWNKWPTHNKNIIWFIFHTDMFL